MGNPRMNRRFFTRHSAHAGAKTIKKVSPDGDEIRLFCKIKVEVCVKRLKPLLSAMIGLEDSSKEVEDLFGRVLDAEPLQTSVGEVEADSTLDKTPEKKQLV